MLSDQARSERFEIIRAHLREILSSPSFAGSKRSQDFLSLIVQHALAGRLDSLRERMIGAEMFGRPIDYDTANDAVVRVKATEVRKRLSQYYREAASPPPVRIELPTGSYEPKFHWPPVETTAPLVDAPDTAANARLDVAAPEPSVADQEDGLEPVRIPEVKRGNFFSGFLMLAIALPLIALAVYLGWRSVASAKSRPIIHAVAILPIQNLTGDPRQDYLTDGITEQLISDLGQIAALRVISRTSSMTYKNTQKTLPQIARELGVDAVVEGAMLREHDRIRVAMKLVDARTDSRIWQHSYERDSTEAFTLQGELSQSIADAISVEVDPEVHSRLLRPKEVDPEAHEFYLKGLYLVNQRDPRTTVEPALVLFEDAIAKDPNYAEAHSAVAMVYGWLGEAGKLPYDLAFSRQKSEALKAIEIDDALSDGHAQLGNAVTDLNWDWATAEREIQRAIQLNPSSASAHQSYGSFLIRMGRLSEGVAEAETALRLDPVSGPYYDDAIFIYYFARQYDRALALVAKAQTLDADHTEFPYPLGIIYAETGRYDEAIRQFAKLGDQPHAIGHAGNAYARAGRVAEARDSIVRLKKHVEKGGPGRYEIALVYAGLGENDEALAWLEKAYQAHDKGITYMNADPCLDPLRADPRFKVLLDRVGFPKWENSSPRQD